MRLPTSRTRRGPEGNNEIRPLTLSIVINLLLGGLLAYSFLSRTELPQVDPGFGGESSAIQVHSLKADLSNLTQALQGSKEALKATEAQLSKMEVEAQVQQKAVDDNLAAMRLERDHLANLNSVLTKQKERPIGVDASGKYWLVVGIPTVPRRDNTSYLLRTLSSLLEELPLDPTDPLYCRVRVLVMNNRPAEHPAWQQVRDKMLNTTDLSEDPFIRKGKLYVDFVENNATVPDPAPDAEEPDDNHNPKNRPGRQVRRQTCDLISLLEMARPLSHYYMFLEDDFRVCPYAIRVLSYTVRKLNTIAGYKNWLAVRFSYGMNGILLHSVDLPLLTAYLRKHTARLPPDLLWTEWYSGRKPELKAVTRGRKLAIYRYNLLDHIGARSSFAVRAHRPDWPRCYHPMSSIWSLAKSEQFNVRRCPDSDISPCPPASEKEIWTKYPLVWPNITEGADLDHPLIPLEQLAVDLNTSNADRSASPRSETLGQAIVGNLANKFAESDVSLSGAT